MTAKATLSAALQSAFDETLQGVNTAIPGHILKFDPSTQLAEVQVGIVRISKSGETADPQPIIQVPVHFGGAGGFRFEHQINAGDTGIIIFSQRCIDAWVDQGGVAPNPILRFHDTTDAFFIPGITPQTKKLEGFENNGCRLTDGTNFLWLKNNGDIEIKGANVKIESSSLTHNGTDIGDSHTHSYSWTDPGGSGNTGGPQ